MSPEAQRIAIAEACGWRFYAGQDSDCPEWHDQTKRVRHGLELPDYLKDLNAMHSAWRVCIMDDEELEDRFVRELSFVIEGDDNPEREWLGLSDELASKIANAIAPQRAEAFLRTIGKWTDSPQ